MISDAQGNKYDLEDEHFGEDPDHTNGDTLSTACSCPASDTAGVSPPISDTNDFDANSTSIAPGHLNNSDDEPAHSQRDDNSVNNTGVDDPGTSQETTKITGVDNTQAPDNQTGINEPIRERKG